MALQKASEEDGIWLAKALSNGALSSCVEDDVTKKFNAPEWVYLVQELSKALVAVTLNIVSSYLYARHEKKAVPRLQDLFTREVNGSIVEYRRALTTLQKYKGSNEVQKEIDVFAIDAKGALTHLERGKVGNIDLLVLLEQYRTMTEKERRDFQGR